MIKFNHIKATAWQALATILTASLLVVLASLLNPTMSLAATSSDYSCGSYGSNTYNSGCTTDNSSGSNPAAPNTSVNTTPASTPTPVTTPTPAGRTADTTKAKLKNGSVPLFILSFMILLAGLIIFFLLWRNRHKFKG